LLMTEAEILERAVAQVFVRKLEPNADDLREQRQDIIDDFTEGLLTGREELAGVIGKLMLKEAWRILEANISLQRQKALLDGSGAGSSSKSKKKQQQQQLDPPLTLPSAPLAAAGGDDQYSVADDDDLHDDDGDASKKRKKNKKKKNKKAKGKSAAKSLPPTAPGHPSADVASAAEDDDEDEDDEATCVYADANDSQRDPQNPFDSLAWMSPSESSAAAAAQQPKQPPVADVAAAAARNGTEPAKKAAVVAQPALQIQTQVQARAPPPPPPQSNDGEAVKAARSRRGTNAARYVPGVGFVSDDGVSATSPQLVASATSTAAGALRAVPPGSVARAPPASGRMSPMSTVRMASPAPRSQSPLVMSGGPTSAILPAGGDRRTLDKDALAKLQASLSLGPAENIERTLSGLTHDSLVALASTAIIERRRTMDSAVEWNKAVDKVLSTYDMIAGQIVSLKTLCESHDSETERLGTLLAQSAQEARKWQEQCVRLSAEVEALKAQNTGKELQPNGNLWSVADQPESNPWAGSGYYGQTYPASNNFGHFAPGLVPPPGHQAQPPAGYMASASSYAAAVAAIQAQAMAQQQMPSQHGQQQQQQSMPLSGSTDTSASSLLTALNTR
ncbi:hypothetical protein GGF41_005487, partial [Coemansia sp. RSA 2531]